MARIVGTKPTSFTPKDSDTPITGTTIYLTEPLPPKGGGVGDSADHIFLSTAKLDLLDFNPRPGQVIEVMYNRYGKPATLILKDEVIDFGNKS